METPQQSSETSEKDLFRKDVENTAAMISECSLENHQIGSQSFGTIKKYLSEKGENFARLLSEENASADSILFMASDFATSAHISERSGEYPEKQQMAKMLGDFFLRFPYAFSKMAETQEKKEVISPIFKRLCANLTHIAYETEDPKKSAGQLLLLLSAFHRLTEKTNRENFDSENPEADPSTAFFAILSGNEAAIEAAAESFCKNAETNTINLLTFSDWRANASKLAEGIKQLKEEYAQKGFGEYSEDDFRFLENFSKQTPSNRFVESVLKKILPDETENIAFLADKLCAAWRKGRYATACGKNLKAIRKLEYEIPGATEALAAASRNIACFSRYDIETLSEQLKETPENEPYGYFASDYADRNGAFENLRDVSHLVKTKSAALGIHTVIFEYDGEAFHNELRAGLLEFSAKNAENPKAEYVWINEHGSGEELPEEIEKRWAMMLGAGKNKTSLVLKKGGTIVADKCFGGQQGGAMETLAKNYPGITTMGPDASPYDIQSMKFERDDEGNLKINVVYHFANEELEKNSEEHTKKYRFDENEETT